MAVAVDLLRAGRRVGVDMEDWFSEDLLPEARRNRPIKLLRSLEKELLVSGAYKSCPSQVMSEALAQKYGCSRPVVIYNAFPWSDRKMLDGKFKDRTDRDVPSIHWFSQTLGRGRGLEDLLASLPFISHPINVHLRGALPADSKAWLWNRVPENWLNRVFIHDLVSNEELLSRISEHDIGFAGEMKYCFSRDLTVTNKILHYLLAGLAVVASDTAGQFEVASRASAAVFLYPAGNPGALAGRINEILESQATLSEAKRNALRAAERLFCWEHQETQLLDTVALALDTPKTLR
jgi:glycosyltransferase involved in cell wall biosynthesis